MSDVDNYHMPAKYFFKIIRSVDDTGRHWCSRCLFIALYSANDVGVQLWKDVGLTPSSRCAVSADHKCTGASTLVRRTVTDGVF